MAHSAGQRMTPIARRSAPLWLCGLGVALPATLFAARYPLGGNAGRLADLGILADYRESAFAGYVVGVSVMFAAYIIGLTCCARLPASTARLPVYAVAAVAVAALATMYPVSAIDLFLYAVRSRLWTEYGADPIATAPHLFPADPWRPFAAEWADDVSPYGPLWNLIAAPATLVAGDDLPFALALYKGLAAISVLLGGAVIDRIASHTGRNGAAAALVYLWNPLVLWEGVGNGHNDVVMMLPILLAFLAWTGRRASLVIPLLVVAAAIKYVAVLLIPLAAVAIWRRTEPRARVRVVVVAIAGSAAVLLVALWPFYDLQAIRRSLDAQGAIMLTSPAAVAVDLLRDSWGPETATAWVRAAGVVGLAAAASACCIAVYRRPGALPRAAFELLFAYLVIAAWAFRIWYPIWLLALAPLHPLGWPAARAIAWSAGGMAAYAFFIWGWHWWRVEFSTIQASGVALIFGPPLIVTLSEVVARTRTRTGRARVEPETRPVARQTLERG